MTRPLFTPEELEELRRADEELDESFCLTPEDLRFIQALDRAANYDRKDNRSQKIAAQRAAYYEANKEKIAARQAAWQKKNRDKLNAYRREYRRKRKEKAAPSGSNTGSGTWI